MGSPEMASRAFAAVQVKTNSIGMKLKLIPAGEFLMGSPISEPGRENRETQHRVKITQPFYMGLYTVTQSQWMAVMGTRPWAEKPDTKEGSDYPATYVSHFDAAKFCQKLSELENTTYRLPTEAKWEYACRARTKTAYCFADTADQLEQYAWFDETTDNSGEGCAHGVGQKFPNAFGLHDMHGNVWEWCSDWFEWHLVSANKRKGGRKIKHALPSRVDPNGPTSGSYRVFRGGGWSSAAVDCRSASRSRGNPSYRSGSSGFRVCLSRPGK